MGQQVSGVSGLSPRPTPPRTYLRRSGPQGRPAVHYYRLVGRWGLAVIRRHCPQRVGAVEAVCSRRLGKGVHACALPRNQIPRVRLHDTGGRQARAAARFRAFVRAARRSRSWDWKCFPGTPSRQSNLGLAGLRGCLGCFRLQAAALSPATLHSLPRCPNFCARHQAVGSATGSLPWTIAH